MNKGLFITGTDTGVGKTLVSAGLIHLLAKDNIRVAGMKPVASGCHASEQGLRNEDALTLMQQANIPLEYDQVNPYAYEPPVSPHFAVKESGRNIDLKKIKDNYDYLSKQADCVIVEGVGGWMVPLNEQHTVADMARLLNLPVLLVVGMRLGCINHTLLTIEAIRKTGLPLIACVGNQIDPEYLRREETLQTLESHLKLKIQKIPWLELSAGKAEDQVLEHDQKIINQIASCLILIKEKIYESV